MTTDSAQGIQGLHAAFWKAKAETSTPQPVARKEDLKSRAFVRMLKARLLHIVAVCIAAASPDLSATYAQVADINIRHWLVIIIFGRLMVVSGAVLAITAAQAWISRRQARLLVMTLAVLVFSAATAVLNASDWYIGLQNIDRLAWTSSGLGLFLHLFWLNTVTTSLLAIVYERQMQADRMMMAVSSTRLADGEVERQTLESRLNSVKARIDPEFLFAVIERSEILYRNDIDAAEVLLDQLIDFLRTSVPQGNGAPSTLEKELALCAGYLEIEAQLRRDALHFQTSHIAAVARHRFPTSILLQLVQSLLPDRRESRSHGLSMRVETPPSCLQIELRCTGAASLPSAQTLDSVTATLQSFFGEQVKVSLQPGSPVGNTLLIEVPNDPT